MSEQAEKYGFRPDMGWRPVPPDNNPKTRVGGANKLPLHLVPATAVAHLALAFADGATKYQGFNWRSEPISASVYYGAARRHIDAWWEGEDLAPDSGVHHLAHAMACLAMILDTIGRPGCLNDNRPPPSQYGALLEELAGRLPDMKVRPEARFDLHDLAKAKPRHADLQAEDVSQDPQLVRIKWRDPSDDWEWFWLLGERIDADGRQFYLRGADDPVTGVDHTGDQFWAAASEIEWMKRVRSIDSADLDQRINAT